ncbi:FadR/GntR family transcriptional regulator [Oceanobacillus profundus]|uniref:FadR family transcriptional regulator n=1 Tax=Oceanobacillus profundus TaxID=372463 RepID=A0A417YLT9_9BACI|nr:FadR/GntR family transcriptional regulator [Oceanobacillus profundus]MCM3399394.1 FadR family transcriptional regulator [Oceanobacillus profundus]MDO6450249.1 FadR/GntR family transcriptional regulator [Oceanobacillus profundus]RHW34354.1 FadR family transcriptional regulator [Oceanobacillus profundus]
MKQMKRLSDNIAEDILSMITIEERFLPGDKLPNEIELSEELQISRTTLREAIRILVTNGVLEIKRGKGTFVKKEVDLHDTMQSLNGLSHARINAKDLYEMRLIFEPEAAYYATLRASDAELSRILEYGNQIEQKIDQGEDRTDVEQKFHKSIAKATHNEFIDKLMPVVFQAIDKGVQLSQKNEQVVKDTLNDHKLIMEFMKARNPEGARSAMKIHILHAMKDLRIE